MSELEFIVRQEHSSHLIILVHGLNGSRETWTGNNHRLVENLEKEELIKNNFDVAIYNYETKIFRLNGISKALTLAWGFFSNKPKENSKIKFNNGIDKISRPLTSRIIGISNNYNTISFVAHSMGGLVTKSAITWLDATIRKKIKLFISLSVPHLGAQLANWGSKILGKNPQIIDLKSFGNFVTTLNRRYAQIETRPKTVYQYGTQDIVVPELSAAPELVPMNLIEATGDNHFSVLLIKNSQTNSLYRRIVKELELSISEFTEIDVGIPTGLTFKSFLDTLLSLESFKGITIEFKNFTEDQLNSKLREGNISADNFTEFLIKLRDYSIYKLPRYVVTNDKSISHFILKTIS